MDTPISRRKVFFGVLAFSIAAWAIIIYVSSMVPIILLIMSILVGVGLFRR